VFRHEHCSNHARFGALFLASEHGLVCIGSEHTVGKKVFHFTPHLPVPSTPKGDASSVCFPLPALLGLAASSSTLPASTIPSLFLFQNRPFLVRVSTPSWPARRRVWARGTLPRMRPRWPEPDHPAPTHGASAASVRGLEREQCKDPVLSFLRSFSLHLVSSWAGNLGVHCSLLSWGIPLLAVWDRFGRVGSRLYLCQCVRSTTLLLSAIPGTNRNSRLRGMRDSCYLPCAVSLCLCGTVNVRLYCILSFWRSSFVLCRNSSLVGGSYSDLTPSRWSCLFRSLWSRYWSSADLLLGIFATISRITMQDMRFLR
jgi:hypothetical protein